jgi:hypothetical protein
LAFDFCGAAFVMMFWMPRARPWLVDVGTLLEVFYVWFHLLLSQFLPGGRDILDTDDEDAAELLLVRMRRCFPCSISCFTSGAPLSAALAGRRKVHMASPVSQAIVPRAGGTSASLR